MSDREVPPVEDREVPPVIEDLPVGQLIILSAGITAIEPIGDVWLDDHIACRAAKVTTERGTVEVSLWWIGGLAYALDYLDSPKAMSEIRDIIVDSVERRCEGG